MNKQLLLTQLSHHQPKELTENTKFAAVAIILHLCDQAQQLFLIKRKVHPNDPWSGQIGLPGGHHESLDGSLIYTAIRETKEETDISLSDGQLIAQINDQQGYAAGGKINLTVRPFVFIVDNQPSVKINYELERFFWLPLEHFKTADNHIYFKPMVSFAERPGVQLDQSNILWGMTYRILNDFFTAANLDSPFVGDYDRTR